MNKDTESSGKDKGRRFGKRVKKDANGVTKVREESGGMAEVHKGVNEDTRVGPEGRGKRRSQNSERGRRSST